MLENSEAARSLTRIGDTRSADMQNEVNDNSTDTYPSKNKETLKSDVKIIWNWALWREEIITNYT